MDDSIVKPAWKKFLAMIQSIHPTAIIAGGALRDTIIGNSIKDVDIFITCPTLDSNDDTFVNEEQLIALFGITKGSDDWVKIVHDFRETKYDGSDSSSEDNGYAGESIGQSHNPILESFITMIAEVMYNSVKYELIFVEDDPIDFVLRDFDIGLCKIFFDGDQLFVTDEFKYDLDNKQLTFSGRFTNGQILHTITKHIPNLKKKFVDWNVVIEDVSVKSKEDMPQSFKRIIEENKKPEVDLIFNKAEANPFVIKKYNSDKMFDQEILNMLMTKTPISKDWSVEYNNDDDYDNVYGGLHDTKQWINKINQYKK